MPEGGVVEVPLPSVDGEGPDREKLIAEQQADATLRNVLELAQRKEKGYAFDQGILVHYSEDSLGDSCQRVVVPSSRRNNVLELAHSNPMAGHFGYKKTYARISQHFLWPRVWLDVNLVGPLPRTSSGNRYILTMMCLFTKYSKAIPLKRVDNVDAMIEIFARHGLPRTIGFSLYVKAN